MTSEEKKLIIPWKWWNVSWILWVDCSRQKSNNDPGQKSWSYRGSGGMYHGYCESIVQDKRVCADITLRLWINLSISSRWRLHGLMQIHLTGENPIKIDFFPAVPFSSLKLQTAQTSDLETMCSNTENSTKKSTCVSKPNAPVIKRYRVP